MNSPFVLVETEHYRVVMNAKRMFVAGRNSLLDRHGIEVRRKDALGKDSWHEHEPDRETLEEIFQHIRQMLGSGMYEARK